MHPPRNVNLTHITKPIFLYQIHLVAVPHQRHSAMLTIMLAFMFRLWIHPLIHYRIPQMRRWILNHLLRAIPHVNSQAGSDPPAPSLHAFPLSAPSIGHFTSPFSFSSSR